MNKKKIMIVFGTRPEATKLCVVINELYKRNKWFEVIVVVTGQHKEQLSQSLNAFGVVPDYNFNLMKDQQTLTYIVAAGLNKFNEIVEKEFPDLIIVHGDTQSTIIGALTAFYNHIPVAHIEAGQRSFNKYSPWPEEVNRRLADVIADIHFAPTSLNKQNLAKEGIEASHTFVTGQTAVDAAMDMYSSDYVFLNDDLNKLHLNKFILITAHRRENYGEPMINMFTAIKRLAEANPDLQFIYPVHLSPKVREAAFSILSNHEQITMLDPIEFPDMVNLIARSFFVMSDSGGLQEECPVFNKPLLLMRDTTERPEAMEAGCAILCGTSEKSIFNEAQRLLNDENHYNEMANSINPFGDGKASVRIADYLLYHYGFLTNQPDEFE